MPNMTGVEVLRQAKEIQPQAIRLLLTGYSDLNAIIASINEGEIFRFINKPWINAELRAIVAQAVSAAGIEQLLPTDLANSAIDDRQAEDRKSTRLNSSH